MMIHLIEPIKAFCRSSLTKSFFIASLLISSLLTASLIQAAEVSRSLSLEDRVRLLEQQLSSANRMRAESQFELTNLKNEIRDLRGLLEEQGYQIQQLITRQRELYKDIDQKLAAASTNDGAVQQPLNQNTLPQSGQMNDAGNISGSLDQTDNNPPVVTSDNTSSAIVTPMNDAQVREAYDKIFPLVREKRYDDAISGYQQFIASYPDSIYVSNSRYWLAQIYSVQGRTDEAEVEYLNVAQQHASSSKAPDAWLKLGQLYERLGQLDKAENAFNQVVTQYADSTAAQMAISRLQSLKSSN